MISKDRVKEILHYGQDKDSKFIAKNLSAVFILALS